MRAPRSAPLRSPEKQLHCEEVKEKSGTLKLHSSVMCSMAPIKNTAFVPMSNFASNAAHHTCLCPSRFEQHVHTKSTYIRSLPTLHYFLMSARPEMKKGTSSTSASSEIDITSSSTSKLATSDSDSCYSESLSWETIEMLSAKLSHQLFHSSTNYNVILAVTRGGLVPASLLSESLQLRNVLSATVIFYTDDGEQFFGMTQPRFLSFPSLHHFTDKNVLIVDDVWDTGRTAQAVKDRVKLLKLF